MAQAKGQVAPGATALAKAANQQTQQGMEPLLRFVEVADAQQLQGPLIDRIQAAGILGLGIPAKQQGREGFHANPLTAEPVGGQLVAGL